MMKKSRSVLAVSAEDNGNEFPEHGLSKSYTSSGTTLGVDLRRGRRRFSGNLQLPPLAWRQGERAKTPERDSIPRPTTLPLQTPPRIAITPVDQDWYLIFRKKCILNQTRAAALEILSLGCVF
ncbi:cAMP-specific 3',5'-cyclic phosphodiesterase 4B-like [Hypanus sabinus]|uniref:cAMP-specific 3',5'-cyclic phosphodiesterase 4B-like n=1 Tax=Hypanus sabinus TaxID=79690 RepID=UPI0028C4C823|nr:cAMP-specific 3',5'-cyclic phosphodiesterase 4B-like [Hypanus sabinus]